RYSWGWRASATCSAVVPALGAPAIRKSGRAIDVTPGVGTWTGGCGWSARRSADRGNERRAQLVTAVGSGDLVVEPRTTIGQPDRADVAQTAQPVGGHRDRCITDGLERAQFDDARDAGAFLPVLLGRGPAVVVGDRPGLVEAHRRDA